jgi:thiamine biosynthesis lipoprotein
LPFYFGAQTWRVIDFEKRLNGAGGLVDITLASLEDLWARAAAGAGAPTREDVQRLLADTGMERLSVPAEPYVRKLKPGLNLSLDTVASGYIADRVATFLNENHVANFHIEMNGVVISQNMPARSAAIPVCKPQKNGGPPPARVALESSSMATVGMDDGMIHVDPHTGYPVSNEVHCVTVVAENGLTATGLASALYLLGTRDGMAWIETNGVATGEALYVVNSPTGGLFTVKTRRFPLAGQ